MKYASFGLLLLIFLTACGQPGPLYLPADKPPIYVEPEPETTETETKEQVKPEPPVQPENTQPTTDQ